MKRFIAVLLIIVLLLSLLVGSGALFLYTGYEVYSDLTFDESGQNKMDIYIPSEAYARERNGCVLFIHGGSWTAGDKSEEELHARLLASCGYIAATMNYSFADEAPDYTVERVLDEIDAALGMLKSFTAEREISLDYAATSGYSAGAHLSMLYSFSRGERTPLPIRFTANLAGPADISPEIWGEELAIRIGELLSGEDITPEMTESGEANEILSAISPCSYINEKTPPSIIVYGGKDNTVSMKNGESLIAEFDKHGTEYKYILMPDSDHALIQNIPERLEYYAALLDYCKKYFK